MLKIISILILIAAIIFLAVLICVILKSRQNLKNPPEYLMILGCKVKKDQPSKTLQSRIDAAAQYLNQNEKVTAFCCGGLVQKEQVKTEAQVIFDGLIKLGVDKNRLILEDKSTTTIENFKNVKALLENMNAKKPYSIAFITSDFHVFRSEIISKNNGLKCRGIGAKSPNKKKIKHYIREVIVMPFAYMRT